MDGERSFSITNEFRDGATPGEGALLAPPGPAAQSPTQPAHSFENQTGFLLPPPLPVYKHVYKCLIGDLIYLVTCGFIYLEISR